MMKGFGLGKAQTGICQGTEATAPPGVRGREKSCSLEKARDLRAKGFL